MKFDASIIANVMRDAVDSDQATEILDRPFEYSATVLCKSPRQVQLERRYKDKIVARDFFNKWYSFFGNAVHWYLEEKLRGNPNYIVERRIVRFDKPIGGKEEDLRRVGAKFDAYDIRDKVLYDHKTTTTFIYGKEMKDEWIRQLMINAYFLEKEGYPVERVAINAIYTDWRDSKMKRADFGTYPAAPCSEFTIPAWSMEDREYLYKSLLKGHIEAETTPDNELPYCSTEYVWETPKVYAIYRAGADRAIKLAKSIEEAEAYIQAKKLKGDIRIEERKATRKRCEDYCDAAPFCNQYQDWLKTQPSVISTSEESELDED